MNGNATIVLGVLAALAALALGAFILPSWAMFLITIALAKGLVALGIVTMMRAGLVSFGQGLYYCIGAYVAALVASATGLTDIFLLSMLAMVIAIAIGALLGPLLAGYRGIFFAMLTLSLSMILYGSLAKLTPLGGTDGMNIAAATFLGWSPEGRPLQVGLFLFSGVVAIMAGAVLRRHFDSEQGLLALATRSNELRVEFLGASVRGLVARSYTIGAALGALGGTIAAVSIGHVDPEFAYWTSSGEFVFIAILAGYLSIPAVFVSAVILELVRSFSNLYFPNTWQMALGIFLLAVIVLLPNGLGSLVAARRRTNIPTGVR